LLPGKVSLRQDNPLLPSNISQLAVAEHKTLSPGAGADSSELGFLPQAQEPIAIGSSPESSPLLLNVIPKTIQNNNIQQLLYFFKLSGVMLYPITWLGYKACCFRFPMYDFSVTRICVKNYLIEIVQLKAVVTSQTQDGVLRLMRAILNTDILFVSKTLQKYFNCSFLDGILTQITSLAGNLSINQNKAGDVCISGLHLAIIELHFLDMI